MTATHTLWQAIHKHVRKREWVSIQDVFAVVELHVPLDAEDRERSRATTGIPLWQRSVREILKTKTEGGSVQVRRRDRSRR